MSSIGTLPTLSSTGWVSDNKTILDKVMAYYLSSHFTSSSMFNKQISSFPYVLATTKNIEDLTDTVEASISKLLSRYFAGVNVSATLKDDPDRGGVQILILSVEIVDNLGRKDSLEKTLAVENNTFTLFTDINNNGT